jgi:hypothetical protein
MTDSYQDLFGKRALIAGEDRERFTRLGQQILDHVKPTNILEAMFRWIDVSVWRSAARTASREAFTK